MNIWKSTLMIAAVACGFGAGYLCRPQHPADGSQLQAQRPPDAAAPADDPSLVVPLPDADSKGMFNDPPLDELRKQFQKQIGFEPNEASAAATASLFPGARVDYAVPEGRINGFMETLPEPKSLEKPPRHP